MYGYIYKITNDINNKIYIGQKKCKKENMTEEDMLNDGYMGSGKILKQAIEKRGIENFTKEIICVCDTKEELDETETLLITLAKLGYGEDCYNIAAGGEGGDVNRYKTEEEMKEIIAKKSETWNNKSEEEKAEINKKRSESEKETRANKTDEEKEKISAKISEANTIYHNITMFDSATLEPLQAFATFKEAHQYLLDNNITTNKSDSLQAYLKYACDNHIQRYGYYWSFNTFIETDDEEFETLFNLCKEE